MLAADARFRNHYLCFRDERSSGRRSRLQAEIQKPQTKIKISCLCEFSASPHFPAYNKYIYVALLLSDFVFGLLASGTGVLPGGAEESTEETS